MENPFEVLTNRLEVIQGCLEQLILANKPAPQLAPIELMDAKLNVDELAVYLNCARTTVLKYKRNGVIPFYKGGKSFYFIKSEVNAALSSTRKIKTNKNN
jgi:excisionase family DNA binding protein